MTDSNSPWQEYLEKFHEIIDEIMADERLDNDEQVRIMYAIQSGMEALISTLQGYRDAKHA